MLALRGARFECRKGTTKTRVPITVPMLKQMILALEGDTGVLEDQALTEITLLAFGFQTGLRPSVYAVRVQAGTQVCCTLQWRHLEWRQGKVIITVEGSKTDPFRNGRRVHLYATGKKVDAYALLVKLRTAQQRFGRGQSDDPVFLRTDTKLPLSYSDLGKVTKRAVTLAGIETKLHEKVTAYSLRRGLITSAYLAGLTEVAIKSITGHQSAAWKAYVYITDVSYHSAFQRVSAHEDNQEWFGFLGETEARKVCAADIGCLFRNHTRGSKKWR